VRVKPTARGGHRALARSAQMAPGAGAIGDGGRPQGEQVEEEGRDGGVRGGGGGLDGLGGAALELKDWRLGAAHSGWRGRRRWHRRSSVGGSSNQRVEGARARLGVDSSSSSRGRTEGAAR
jgi:hypothetical protein